MKPAKQERSGYFYVKYSVSGLRTLHNVNDLCNTKHAMLREIGNPIQVDQLVVSAIRNTDTR